MFIIKFNVYTTNIQAMTVNMVTTLYGRQFIDKTFHEKCARCMYKKEHHAGFAGFKLKLTFTIFILTFFKNKF